jgi:hypothetical protein
VEKKKKNQLLKASSASFSKLLCIKWQVETETELGEGDDWEYVEEGPAEIIWQGNEIIVKKKKVRVPKRSANQQSRKEVCHINHKLSVDNCF